MACRCTNCPEAKLTQLAWELEQAKQALEIEKNTWRCFHCGFETADIAEAQAHFGDRDDAEEFTPFCTWWAKLSEEDRAKHAQDLQQQFTAEQEENGRLLARSERLQERVDNFESEIGGRFKGCRSINDVWNEWHSMEGRALAAEKLWDYLEQRGVLSVVFVDSSELNPPQSLRAAVLQILEAEWAAAKTEVRPADLEAQP